MKENAGVIPHLNTTGILTSMPSNVPSYAPGPAFFTAETNERDRGECPFVWKCIWEEQGPVEAQGALAGTDSAVSTLVESSQLISACPMKLCELCHCLQPAVQSSYYSHDSHDRMLKAVY
jgi:hypothetical protein